VEGCARGRPPVCIRCGWKVSAYAVRLHGSDRRDPQPASGAVSTNYFEFNISFNDSIISSGSSYYFPSLHSANTNGSTALSFTNGNVVVSPLACTVSQLAVGSMVYSAGATTGAATITLMQGHNTVTPTASALTCTTGTVGTTAGTQQSCTDNSHTVSIAAGDTLSLRLAEPSATNSTAISYYNIHMRCQ